MASGYSPDGFVWAIDRVAGLDAEIKIRLTDHIDDVLDIGRVLCLNIAQNKEARRR